MTGWIVLKFGGTSVSSRDNWNNIAGVVARRRAAGARVLIVHSAISGITDPVASFTVPEMLPVVWALAGAQTRKRKKRGRIRNWAPIPKLRLI